MSIVLDHLSHPPEVTVRWGKNKRELNTYEWEKQPSYGLHGRTRARTLSKILSLSHNFLRNFLSLEGFINTLHMKRQADHNPSSDSQIPVFIPSTNEQMSSLARFISRPSTYALNFLKIKSILQKNPRDPVNVHLTRVVYETVKQNCDFKTH